jgi:hypothetical protein
MNDDDLTTNLTRELRDRSDAMDGTSLGLSDVRGRARSIRRRRTATGIVAAAAALAVIVPTAALATHQGGHRTEPLPATQSVTPTPSATVGAQPAPGVFDASDLPAGPAPAVDYVYRDTLHLADGTSEPVRTRHAPTTFVELADGAHVWLTADDSGQSYVEIEDADGTFHDPVRSTSDLRVNAPHSIAAWLTPQGQVMIWEGWASQPRPLGDPVPATNPSSDLRLGPVTGNGTAPAGQAGPDCAQFHCAGIVNVSDAHPQPWTVDESGSQPLHEGRLLDVKDATASGLMIGFSRITDSSTCSVLGGGTIAWISTCTNQLTSFSPDGRLIAALPGYFDGAGAGGFAMVDVKGTTLFDRRSTVKSQATLADDSAVWEDATHVLVPVYQEGSWSLVRIASDGSMEYAVAPRPGVDVTVRPYVLPTGGNLPTG